MNASCMTKALFSAVLVCLLLSACTARRPPEYSLSEGVYPGEEYTVERGDNLYTIAQKNGVRVRDIIVLNNLDSPSSIKIGQTLVLPTKDRYAAPSPKSAPMDHIDKGYMGPPSSSITGDAVTAVPLDPIAPPQPASKPMSFYEPVSTLPPGRHVVTTTYANAPALPQPAPVDQAVSGSVPPITEGNAGKIAPMEKAVQESSVAKAVSSNSDFAPSFAWPVRGTVISGFGPKGQGLDNDGINIAAPKGSPVKAAEAGIVAYAGNEMKGFGNLVLIRHEGGWVTAYAHLERMVVARDAIVAKGDMIGSIGNTGGVGSPQLHFEARQEGKPVDPELVLK